MDHGRGLLGETGRGAERGEGGHDGRGGISGIDGALQAPCLSPLVSDEREANDLVSVCMSESFRVRDKALPPSLEAIVAGLGEAGGR